jgi:hypothetical protein
MRLDRLMKAVFTIPIPADDAHDAMLKGAVAIACNELIEVHDVDAAELESLVGVLASTILERFKEGHRDAPLMAQCAILQALKQLGRMPN